MADSMMDTEVNNTSTKPQPGSQSPIPPSRVLGVFGMSIFTRERDLEDIFSAYGKIEKIDIIRSNGRSRGFGFIYFERQEDAELAKEKANGLTINERTIRVDYSRTGAAHAPTPGFYNGRPIAEVIAERRDRERASGRRRYNDRGHGRDSDRHYVPSRRYDDDRRRGRDRSRSRSRSPVRRSYGGRDRGYDNRDRYYGGDRDSRRRSRSRSRDDRRRSRSRSRSQ